VHTLDALALADSWGERIVERRLGAKAFEHLPRRRALTSRVCGEGVCGELKCLVVGELRALLFRSVVGASRGSRPAAHRAVIEPLWIRYLTVRTSFPMVMLIE
jgi:hypothetical protein